MGRMDGRAAVITGASGGIGWATAKRYVAEGAAVIAADIDDARGAEMVADIGGAVTYVHCDVTDPDQVRAAVDRCVSDHGRIDVIFNNAATSTGGYVADLDLDGFDASLSVMLKGPLLGRTIRPEEIADLALFLGSDESSAITGQAVVIDGGLLNEINLTGVPPLS